MDLYIRDPRLRWGKALAETARRRGWNATEITACEGLKGFGFIRPHANPEILKRDRILARDMAKSLTMITDLRQVEVYDDKRAQHRLWAKWMPETWVFENEDDALAFAESAGLPLISKADVGASSLNVRYLETRAALISHIKAVFGSGLSVNHCAGDGYRSLQKGYVLLQRFIPHDVTYRVNAVGSQRAVFFRSCYPDRPLAQTGNVRPAYTLDDVPEGLLEFANAFYREAETKWCALDILRDGEGWKLLETSLAWPHPSPGDCNNGTFFPSGRKWIEMWDVLLDECSTFTSP